MRRAVIVAALLLVAAPAHSQTQTLQQQITQLRNYVIQLATKRNEDFIKLDLLRQENVQLRAYLAAERVFMVDFTCKYNLLTTAIAGATSGEPTKPITFIQGVQCGQTDPAKFPAPLFPELPQAAAWPQ